MTRLAIIDYGMGNLNSVAKAFTHIAPDADVRIATTAADVARADRIVLPGQAAMPDSMKALHASGLFDATVNALKTKPSFGMCLGLQMLFDHSDEGDTPCLHRFPGRAVRFPLDHRDHDGTRLKVPHMGWNAVQRTIAHPLWRGIENGSAFYFANSYICEPAHQAGVAGVAHYPHPFCVAYGQENVFAVQFHPEKSALAGLTLLQNFLLWEP
jgi:imidazole glycerol-phosphate synthase subunit HisH